MKQSYAHDVFLAEEIGLSVARNISPIPPTLEPIKTEETRPTVAHIVNHNIKANVWTEIKFPKNMGAWQMSCRDDYEIQYCFEPSASTYKTLKSGGIVSEDTSPDKSINAIYVRCVYDTIIEIEIWKV